LVFPDKRIIRHTKGAAVPTPAKPSRISS
jgi:hypothetical protein